MTCSRWVRNIHTLLFVLLLLLLAACSPPAPGVESPVTIRWLLWNADIAADTNLQEEIRLFNGSHPKIQVEVLAVPYGEFAAKLQSLTAAGTPPDVVSIQNTGDFVVKGFLRPLDDLIARDIDPSKFVPGAIAPAYDEKVYGLRHDTGFWLLFYNKDLFDQAAIPYPPAEGYSIEQFMDTACRISAPSDQVWGMYNWNWIHQYVIQQQGGRYLVMDGGVPTFKLDEPQAIQTMQQIGDFINEHNCQIRQEQSDSLGVADPFLAGKTAMTLDGNWAFGKLAREADFRWDVAAIPGLKQPISGMTVGIHAASAESEAAWTFLKWLTYEPEATRFRAERGMGQPALVDKEAWNLYLSSEEMPPGMKALVERVTRPDAVLPTDLEPPGATEALDILSPAIDEIWLGTKAASEALPPAVAAANRELAQEWQQATSK